MPAAASGVEPHATPFVTAFRRAPISPAPACTKLHRRLVMTDATAARLLIADDQPDVLEALRLLLSHENFLLQLVTSPAVLVDRVRAEKWDAVLMDLNYSRDTTSGDEGLQLLSQIRTEQPDLPVVVMTAWGNIELAVAAMRAGAQSFVQKPWDNRALIQVLEREVAEGRGARARSDRHASEQQDALRIQRALMPEKLPVTDRFEVVGAWQPAGTLGGDTYDAFLLRRMSSGCRLPTSPARGCRRRSSCRVCRRRCARSRSTPRRRRPCARASIACCAGR